MQFVHHVQNLARRPLAAADAWMNRAYGWRFNPLYQSGTLAVASFLVMLASGLYLLLYYRIGSPWESIVRIESQAFSGRWLRAIHRYAADLAVAAGALHAFRMFVQRRSWGARTLAWVSGLLLMLLVFLCGWTGYVMLWDDQAQLLAVEGARLLDALPIFSEPIGRTFVGDQPLPSAFFFLNLFLHIAIPIGMALLFWLHVSRLARPLLLPPRELLWGSVGVLFVASLLAPAPLGPQADLHAVHADVKHDLFYAFWLPLSRRLEPGTAWAVFGALALLLATVPLWSRPPRSARPLPSVGNEKLCTGCDQCSLDCPYDAIRMIPREADASERFARVTEKDCVSCGICAGSCAPMAVGPPLRSGRDELAQARAFAAERALGPGRLALVACHCGAGGLAGEQEAGGAPVFAVECAGSLHTSVIETLLRAGSDGVLVAACPPRDCWHREGPKWLDERLYHGREAELRESLDRSRLRVVWAGEGERREVLRAVAGFRAALDARPGEAPAADADLARECERAGAAV
jgi:coenzyme F420-reducing hydrogenase delta subunit/Pyruvate/2-oxoacid:ferredoxin oxidoreductase delta subunit